MAQSHRKLNRRKTGTNEAHWILGLICVNLIDSRNSRFEGLDRHAVLIAHIALGGWGDAPQIEAELVVIQGRPASEQEHLSLSIEPCDFAD
jgi:hypothetical protein